MKIRKLSIIIASIAILGGCTGMEVQTQNTDPVTGQSVTTTTIDVTKSEGAIATHDDLLGAAAVARKSADSATDLALKAALTARAAWWTQQDAMLTARETQISACLNAIRAMKPELPEQPAGAGPHVFTSLEVAAEAVGKFSGLTPAVKLACEPLPIPPLPVLPVKP